MSEDFDRQAVWAYVYKSQKDAFTNEPEPHVVAPALRLGHVAITSIFYEDDDCVLTHVPTGCRMGGYLPIVVAKEAAVLMLALGEQLNTTDPHAIRNATGPILEDLGILPPTWRDSPFTESIPELPTQAPEPTP